MNQTTPVKTSAWRMPQGEASPEPAGSPHEAAPSASMSSRLTLARAALAARIPPSRPSLGDAWRRLGLSSVWARVGDVEHELIAHGGGALVALIVVATSLGAVSARDGAAHGRGSDILALSGGDFSERGLRALASHLPPGAELIAARFAPQPRAGFQQGAPGDPAAEVPFESGAPVFTTPRMAPDAARALNAALPISTLPNPPAKPFVLQGGEVLDQTRAVDCLTAAIYYESATEPLEGQQAVAQVVLNRVRHPAYPKTVCGVVFQGANRTSGCQFTFTCDGSLGRKPVEALWRRSHEVAVAALNGFVMKRVGNATHYHAVYVAPYWNTSLIKVADVGSHIFYRWTGGAGQPPSFAGLYAGAEPQVMPASLSTPPAPSLDALAAVALADPNAASSVASAPAASSAPSPANLAAAASAPPESGVKPAEVAVVAQAPVATPPPPPKRRNDNWSRLPVPGSW